MHIILSCFSQTPWVTVSTFRVNYFATQFYTSTPSKSIKINKNLLGVPRSIRADARNTKFELHKRRKTRRKVHEKRKKKKVEDREGAEGRPKFGAQPRRAPLSYSPATPQPHPLIIRVNSQGSEWRSREKEFTKLSYIVQRMLPYKSLSPPPAVASSTLHILISLYTA